jgi:hypothetical protein
LAISIFWRERIEMARNSARNLGEKLCSCIKQVRKTVTLRKKRPSAREKESAAIGICVKGVLHTRGKTIRKFKCGKRPTLKMQKMISHV